MKKIFSIFIIVLLLLTTTVIPVSFNCSSYFVYADTDYTSEEKSNLALSMYMNSRNGWFKSSNSTPVISIINAYALQFFDSPSNTTGINSFSDLASHVDINNDNNISLSVDDTGITFLNNWCKWLLGKNEFPNLYSGGAWGVNGNSTDEVYDGYFMGGNLVSVIDGARNYADGGFTEPFLYNASEVSIGNIKLPRSGTVKEDYLNKYPNTNFMYGSTQNNPGNSDVVSVKFSSDYTGNYTFYMSGKPGTNVPDAMKVFYPRLSGGASGSVTNETGNVARSFYLNNGSQNVRSCFTAFVYKNCGKNNKIFYGWISHWIEQDKYVPIYMSQANLNYDSPTTINFDTIDFVKNDLNEDLDITDFVPQYTNDGGNTYNTYNDYDNFYNDYFYDYSQGDTIINNDSSGDDNPPVVPSSPGTVTPDGNGGFTFELPDFSLPDLSGLNWSISGLTEKFPFSIPFDLLAFFTVLNAEPETPELQGTINLGLVDWSIDWDLHNFDNIASLLRNLEFIGFCIALILITRRLIKG